MQSTPSFGGTHVIGETPGDALVKSGKAKSKIIEGKSGSQGGLFKTEHTVGWGVQNRTPP
jgi:hypothetical protein